MFNYLKIFFNKSKSIEGDENVLNIFNSCVDLLREKKFNDAQDLAHGIFPVNGPISFDYALYQFEYSVGFPQVKFSHEDSVFKKLQKVYKEIKEKNYSEYKVFINSNDGLSNAVKQSDNAEAHEGVELIKSDPVNRYGYIRPDPAPRLLIDAYKDKYEIEYFINLLANLFIMQQGGKYSNIPLSGKKYHKKEIYVKGRMKKGLAIYWVLEQVKDLDIKKYLQRGYDITLRNYFGGHNDYVYNEKKHELRSIKNKNIFYSLQNVMDIYSSLNQLQRFIYLERAIRKLEDNCDFLQNIGILDIKWRARRMSVDSIGIYQFWANNLLRLESNIDMPKKIVFYRTPIQGKEKVVSVSIGKDLIFPYDYRFIANKRTLSFLKKLVSQKSVLIHLFPIAPIATPFNKKSYKKFSITASKQRLTYLSCEKSVVTIVKEPLKELIKHLESVI